MEAEEKTAKSVKVKTAKPRVKKPGKAHKDAVKTKFYGTGRRKSAVAKVWLKPGKGQRIINGKTAEDYFCKRAISLALIEVPFNAVSVSAMDLIAEVFGGGISSQADAVRMGAARALIDYNPDYRQVLRRLDLLKRDPREKERKKAGLKRARKAFQYSKR